MRRAAVAFVGLAGFWACGTVTPIDPNDGGGRGGGSGSGSGGKTATTGAGGATTTGSGGSIGPGAGGAQGHGGAGGGGGGTGTGGAIGTGGATGTGGVIGTGGIIGTGGASGKGGSGSGGIIGTGGVIGTGGATGSGGIIGTGGAGGTPCTTTTCAVGVYYTCRGTDSNQVSMLLDVQNLTSQSIPLSQITVRYWYTSDLGAASQVLECDYAAPGCASVTSSFVGVSPARPGANLYFELGFTAAAGPLYGNGESGQLQFRLHARDYSSNPQTDDYSYDCSMMNLAFLSKKITAYVGGQLVWGVEP